MCSNAGWRLAEQIKEEKKKKDSKIKMERFYKNKQQRKEDQAQKKEPEE